MFTPDIGQAQPIQARDAPASAVAKLPPWIRLNRRADAAIIHVNASPRQADRAAVPHVLSTLVAALDADPAVRAIVLTGPCAFTDCEAWPLGVLDAFAACDRPTVAAIPAHATGAGLSLSLACDARVATSSARFALPGIRSGVLPASQTIARLAQLVPLPRAIELMAFGTTLTADKALACGLIDLVAPGPIVAAAIALARRLDGRDTAPARPRGLADHRAQFERRAPGQEAPLAALAALEHALTSPGSSEPAIGRVRRAFASSEQGQAMRAAVAAEARVLWTIPAAGGHLIGSVVLLGLDDIAATLAVSFARAGVDVTIARPEDQLALDAALAATGAGPSVRGRIRFGPASGAADLILAGPETTAVQWRAVAASLGQTTRVLGNPLAPDRAIEPARCASWHVFAPGGRIRLVELDAGLPARTVPALLRAVGLPLLQRPLGGRGILVERLRWPMLREAIHLLDEGAAPRQVDTALLNFGFTAAPFAALDREGLVAFAAGRVDADHDGPAWLRFSPTLDMMIDGGRHGAGHASGWYRYEAGSRTPYPAPEVDLLLRDSALAQRLRRREIADAEIVERCLAAAVNTAFALLHAGEAEEESVIDAVWTGVIGFPRWRGGLLRHARQVGLTNIALSVARVHRTYGTMPPPHPALLAAASESAD